MNVMRIKTLRREKHLTQAQLAEKMGVINSAVANWEAETTLPRARQLPLLAAVLGCSINDLFVSAKEE